MPFTQTVVTTTLGDIAGAIENGVEVFRGVPFAADAGGENRLRAPQPREPWEGVRDATQNGLSSIQMFGSPPQYAVPDGQGEDCLHVNIWTPDSTATGLPVFVFFHGGAWIAGSNSVETYNSEAWANRGFVAITMNYRLGALGFLYLDEIVDGADGTGILGALDLLAGLEWIRDNIASFGGDPDNVTIAGSSAGGGMVNVLMGMPAARPLFHRAFPMSIGEPKERQDVIGDPVSRSHATGLARVFLDWIGLPDATMDDLRALPADSFRLTREFNTLVAERGADWLMIPVPGHPAYPVHYFEALRNGDAAGIQLLAGVALDENGGRHTRAMTARGSWAARPGMPAADAELDLLDVFPGAAEAGFPTVQQITDVYRADLAAAGRPDDDEDIYVAAKNDAGMVLATARRALLQAGRRDDTYFMLFAYPSPMSGGVYGAFHGVATPLLFARADDPNWAEILGTPAPAAMADALFDALVAFARTGDPNAVGADRASAGLPLWKPFTVADRNVMVVAEQSALVLDPLGARLELHGVERAAG